MGYIKFAVLVFLFSLPALKGFAQDRKYDPLWKRVDSLSKGKGLTKSALTEVEKIYQLAKKENNSPQLIKSLIYRLNLQEAFAEDALQKSITQLEAEIKTTREPAASILNSMLAEKYWQYFQQFRYKLYGRTEMAEEKEQLDSWSIPQFHRKISEKFLQSVKNERLLQQVPLQEFEPIIVKGNTRNLRPTLFDLLAHRAINYFRNEERDVIRPAYAFYINDPAAFADAAEFIRHRFITTDTLSLQHKALTLYQSVLRFHANDADPAAVIDADIQRIEFIRQYGQMENKDSLYLSALEGIVSRFPDYKTAADAYARIAQFYAYRAAQYDAIRDTNYRYDYVKASEIAEKVLKANGNSEGSSSSAQLLRTINQQTLLLHTEKVNIPERPFRTLVNYKNVQTVHLKIIPVSDPLKEQLRNRYNDNYWQRLTAIAGLRNWSQRLPETNDHQQHAAEIKIDALPAGNYILLASGDEKFSLKGNAIAAQHFFVSNISYVNNGNDFFFLHRETGKPLANATVQVWNEGYDYTTRKQVLQAAERVSPDEHGFIRIKKRDKPNIQIKLNVTYNNDRLFQDEHYYGHYEEQRREPSEINAARYEQENSRVFFFTDRSIYRPGQKVFFKGIAITRDFQTRKNKLLAAYKTVIKLFNANHEIIDSISVTTSEYGSYHGNFQLPDHGMNGAWFLYDDKLKKETFFSVEEYKRPKFYISYEEIKTTYRLNDSIRISGSAKAYAGNNLEGAVVNYSVTREPRFVHPWLRSSRWGFPRTSRMNVANGTAVTDAEGNFTIVFKAIPDRSIDTSLQPVFDYKIVASITDINGENRVGEKVVSVSYKALQLDVSLQGSNTLPVDSLKAIKISTLNMNGQAEPSVVRLQIFRLKAPDRMIRQRYWQTPDQFLMSKDEFLRHFPNDEYQEESEVQHWPRQEKVFEVSDSATRDSRFALNSKLFSEGWYVAEAVTKDRYGSEVKNMLYFQLFDEKNNKVSLPLYSWNAQDKISIEPGEQLKIGIGSAAGDLFVIQHTDRRIDRDRYTLPADNDSPDSYQFLTLNKEKKWLPFTAKESDKGGFGVFHFFVKDNRFYMLSNVVAVPWSDKNLSVSYETFRDKVLPGSEEKWKVKISGSKKEKVAGELLASMYDASLDQFRANEWMVPGIWPVYNLNQPWSWRFSFTDVQAHQRYQEQSNLIPFRKTYDRLLASSYHDLIPQDGAAIYGSRKAFDVTQAAPAAGVRREGLVGEVEELMMGKVAGVQVANDMESSMSNLSEVVVPALGRQRGSADDGAPVQLRKNFNETAFFLPELKTDADGNVEFAFTVPEALTRWKFQALSHTKDLAFAFSTKEIVTQKELMVQPNAPRFLREGDRMELSTKVVNLSDKEITGTVQLELLNAATMQPVDGWFQHAMPQQFFTVEAGKSGLAAFRIEVPYQYNSAVIYRFIARSTAANNTVSLSDGEEAMLPVLSNSLLVTETLPLPVRGKAVKNFRFEKLLNAGGSETLKHHALTVEFTSNPAWYVVQALPYLAAPTYESADQLFNRYYANALAFNIANSSPRLREIFERWKHLDTAALLSNLQKNQELKSILLQETPWVLQGKTESQQKQNIALLFDVNKMGSELSAALEQVKNMQSPNGGFQWFKGAPDDIYITQYILTSIGHLRKLNAVPPKTNELLQEIIGSAIKYLDERIKDNYEKLTRRPKVKLTDNHIGPYHIQYLYMRSFFSDVPISGSSFTAVNFYRKQAQQYWLKQSRYMQGMIALALFRTGDKEKAREIIRSLEENSLYNEEMGRYWKENTGGFYWYQAPVETQTLLIEAFSEIGTDKSVVNELKTWLLKQKQTQNWKTTKATAEACYALLLPFGAAENRGIADAGWLASEPAVEIKLGEKIVRSSGQKSEAGTGYFKHTYDASFIQPQMGNISVSVTTDSKEETPSWGAVYWQYFERLDKVTTASGTLKLEKKLFVEKNTDRGPLLEPVTEGYLLKKGDKIKVRIELSTDRDMEYVHMKDMRASCMEPVNVVSRYKWQGGLGYYETTKDAATNFFFSWLPKGSYVFEYPMFVSHTGNFSNGITSVQCLYAPEFASHSEGVRVNVE